MSAFDAGFRCWLSMLAFGVGLGVATRKMPRQISYVVWHVLFLPDYRQKSSTHSGAIFFIDRVC
jgi:hypothetical protein